jgi:hypothetical protein
MGLSQPKDEICLANNAKKPPVDDESTGGFNLAGQ